MKNTLILLVFILKTTYSFGQSDDWFVQVAVFDKQVPGFYFSELNHSIYYSKDINSFHRYFIGRFDEKTATQKTDEMKKKGYYASAVHSDVFDTRCACFEIPFPKEISASLRSIFFDFDSYSLRPDSKRRLERLVENLNGNSSYTAKLMAHTDAKGSDSYNEQLSLKRANAARRYLRNQGIAASRIQIETFGETHPIAKNQLPDGSDTEEGRQFNRRVELVVLDAEGHAMNVVEDIRVPAELALSDYSKK